MAGERRQGSSDILESHKELSCSRTSGWDPVILRSTGKQAPNGSVPSFRGSQKDNGHPPNGGPGGSARRFRPAAPPGVQPTCARPRTQQSAGTRCSRRDAGPRTPADVSSAARSPAFVRLVLLPHSAAIARPKSGVKSKRRPTRKRRHRRLSSKQTLLGRPGGPRAPPASPREPRADPRPESHARPAPPHRPLPRGARGRADGSAHPLPRWWRPLRRRPAAEWCLDTGRRDLILLHRGRREPRDSRRRWRRADVTRSAQPARAGALPSAPIREEPELSGRGLCGERADRLAEEEEREGEQASRREVGAGRGSTEVSRGQA